MSITKLLKNYNELGHKEFMRKWKEGVNQATPLQQTSSQVTFTKITLLGIALGFGVTVFSFHNLWWLMIILGAAFGNTYVSLIALKQKETLLKSFEIVDVELPIEIKTEEVQNEVSN